MWPDGYKHLPNERSILIKKNTKNKEKMWNNSVVHLSFLFFKMEEIS